MNKLNFEPGNSYKIKLMPNYKNPAKSTGVFKAVNNENPWEKYEIAMSFALIDEKIEIISLPRKIRNAIRDLVTGIYINDEGLIITNDDDVISYSIEDNNVRRYYDESGEFNDLNYIKHINIFDIFNPYEFTFDVEEINDFNNFINVKLIKTTPLIERMSKEEIIKLYDGLDDIKEYTKLYMNEIIEKDKSNKLRYILI